MDGQPVTLGLCTAPVCHYFAGQIFFRSTKFVVDYLNLEYQRDLFDLSWRAVSYHVLASYALVNATPPDGCSRAALSLDGGH